MRYALCPLGLPAFYAWHSGLAPLVLAAPKAACQPPFFLIIPCYYLLDNVSTCLIFLVTNQDSKTNGRRYRRMTEKKPIKIQTDSKKAEINEDQTEATTSDDQNTNGDSDRIKELEAKLESKEKEAEETYDRLLRVSAEFDNYKKRSTRELEDYRKFANQSLIKEMLSVVDNLELAMDSTDGHKAIDKDLLQGLEMTHKEILKVFEKFNVKPIEAKGQPFDPTFHEAVMQEETNDSPKNTVINELQRGYMIHDRLLRPSMVVVAKPKENKDSEDQHET
jgi:molecular chaperone GrpE